MRIGLDIDNVVTDFDKKILEEFYKEDKKKRNKGIINPNGNWIKNMVDWSVEEVEDFFNDNMQEFAKVLEHREDAKYYMDKLLDDGHSLHLISHRAHPHYTEPYKITENWLKDNNINYTKLILSKATNKSKECKENNIDVMFLIMVYMNKQKIDIIWYLSMIYIAIKYIKISLLKWGIV